MNFPSLGSKLNGDLRNFRPEEIESLNKYSEQLEEQAHSPELIMANFARYVRTQDITRFLVMYEIFKKITHVHGSIIEVGVLNGAHVFAFAHFCEIFEHRNYTRKVYGFDTFEGYPELNPEKDGFSREEMAWVGFKTKSYGELCKSVDIFSKSIILNQFEKIKLIKGDAVKAIPKFVNEHPELIVSLLVCECDIYDPTYAALKHLYPRMPKGGILLFVSTNFEKTPGETVALNEVLGIENVRLERFPFATKFAFLIKE